MKKYVDLIKQKFTPKTVLEIGSRDGHDACCMMAEANANEQDVYVVEPNPTQANYIKKTYPKYNLIEKAIFNVKGKLTFNQVIHNDLGFVGVSSLLDRNDNFYGDVGYNKIEVDVITGEELLSFLPDIDLCKIDVEGATYEVLESFGDKISQIKSFHLENEHKEVWKNQKLYDDVAKLLEQKGYTLLDFSYVSDYKLQSDSIWILSSLV